jgi:hypothetical protein
MVSLAVPEKAGAPTLCAVMVTGLAVGIETGGVYSPLEEMVPTMLEPPARLFTNQRTEVLDSFVTEADN